MNTEFMEQAVAIARAGMRSGQGGPFGAVIVRRDEIIGRGCNRVLATNDPTAHAEIVAIRDACARLGQFQLHDCALYTTCEPCPMCLGAIYWTRIDKLYFAAGRQDAADAGFMDDFLYRELALSPEQRQWVPQQLLRETALELFVEWQNKPDKKPY